MYVSLCSYSTIKVTLNVILLGDISFLFFKCLIFPAFSFSFSQNVESAKDVIYQLFFCNFVTFMLYSIICFSMEMVSTSLSAFDQILSNVLCI